MSNPCPGYPQGEDCERGTPNCACFIFDPRESVRFTSSSPIAHKRRNAKGNYYDGRQVRHLISGQFYSSKSILLVVQNSLSMHRKVEALLLAAAGQPGDLTLRERRKGWGVRATAQKEEECHARD